MTAVTPAEGAEDGSRIPDTGRLFLAWRPDSGVPRIVRPIGPGDEVYEQFWGGDAIMGHPEHWAELPSPDDAQALAEAREEVAALTAQVETMRVAMKWVSQVRPATLQDGGARVEMTWEEFNAMRIATGLLPQIPSRRTRAALAQSSPGEKQ